MKLSLIKLATTFLLLVCAGVCMLALWIGIYQIDYFERIYPGVTVWGVELGGLDKIEATERLSRHIAFCKKRQLY